MKMLNKDSNEDVARITGLSVMIGRCSNDSQHETRGSIQHLLAVQIFGSETKTK